jgi:carboxyl-terminal processing protease
MSFDPHSSYFSPSEKRNFESSISPEAFSYGFEIEDNPSGTVQISRLVPGGPAWKSNELHKGDVLVQVHWPNGETVDFSCSDRDEADEILQSSASDKMELTVKKPNGQLKSVMLIKKMLKADENLIKSFVLRGKKSIGYISLPGFYTEWENQDPAGCSNDIAKEIVKLKQENIEGIIIDLRNNGGGAMSEAIALAGTFIEGGPLSILSERNRKLTLLRDASMGTVYDGPLVLMVNGFSASASEILAASLQDYHRALIVGSPTFGKATGQIIVPLDSSAKPQNEGFVKITTSRFYRLNGLSYQRKGVVPDVILPAYFEGFSYQEVNQPYAFETDSVVKKVHYTPLPNLPVNEVNKKSKDRIAGNERFRKISSIADSLQQVINQLKAVPINIDLFRKKEAWIFDAIQLLGKEEEQPSTLLQVYNVKYDQYLNNLSTYRKEINDLIIKNLQSDIYLEESYQIINDLINSN